MALAKTLGNLPPNICHPSYLAEQAQAMAKPNSSWAAKFLSAPTWKTRHALPALGRPWLAPAAQADRPQLQGRQGQRKPIVLVGKGVTFDTGGISLKPAPKWTR
jgi:leucyl aminopeptidase